jgi:hypothetical protein
MFERYTEKARRAVFFARYEASQFGSSAIDPEHLLLGLIREEKSLRPWIPKLDAQTIREQVEKQLGKGTQTSTATDLPLSDPCKHVLESAMTEADRLGDKYVGTEHLLLGLLADPNTFAARLLLDGAGANAASIRQYFAKQNSPSRPASLQRTSLQNYQSRRPSGESVEIHGSRWNIDYVHDAMNLVRAYNWHWHKEVWRPRDIVIYAKDGTCSFDLTLAEDSTNFVLVKDGWKKDHCFVCRWELREAEDEHGIGYTNGHDWLCTECYERFWLDPGFFTSSYSDIT